MATKVLNVRMQQRTKTSAEWETETTPLLLGEIGIESDTLKMKIGDGTKTWPQLSYAGVDEEQINNLIAAQEDNFSVGEATGDQTDADVLASFADPKKGDIAAVKHLIATDKYSYTAYVYNGEAWSAMDGNYSAENVYFKDNLTFTEQFGKYKADSTGSVVVPAANKSVKDLLLAAFASAKNPTVTKPSLSITASQMKSYEAGSTVTPTYSLTLNPGSYTYGPATGVTATSYSAVFNGETLTTSSGTFASVQAKDGINLKIVASVQYSDGTVPKNNLGEEVSSLQIKAGSASASSSAITAYRNTFYGTMSTKGTVDSAAIRNLTKSGEALADGATFNVSIPVGAVRVVIAYPATLRDLTLVKDVNGMNAAITSAFTLSTVQVEGANGYEAIDYKVYTMDFASANDTANTYAVTI